ncbi:MAG: hypothetical protein K9K66_10250 [Desulfarculaceae bacterium]|nr:hypothetical protein [Desulfarculaceae bacterium]MCF8073789.1 hypothetical protein [Desulfarculaceae bacterium]MCF8102030.1 hypothetical protein [Desulfarculaceae bacterium]MCF8116000.1 hypothetical protein [Desulfarculaceae bacterium]
MMIPRDNLTLVDPAERLSLELGGSRLYYRRLSLGALAAIERQQMLLMPAAQGQGPRLWLPPEALNAAIAAHVLVGWDGVRGPAGPAPYGPEPARLLPAGARAALVRRAFDLDPPDGETP